MESSDRAKGRGFVSLPFIRFYSRIGARQDGAEHLQAHPRIVGVMVAALGIGILWLTTENLYFAANSAALAQNHVLFVHLR